ncbi:MAG: hypothetical protein P4L84_28210 [Isosphaeraceae bacterium]|nr:hypothetical protein [Isosphaeraceae bacterium]
MATQLDRPAVRWRMLLRWALIFAVLAAAVGGVAAFRYWIPLFPRALGRRLTEGFLRAFLIGYVVGLALALPGAVLLSRVLLRARRRRQSRPRLARCLLLCVAFLTAVTCLEAAAGAWLAWAHRMPALPARFREFPPGEISIVSIGGSSALGYPYSPRCSPAQIVARQLEKALPGRKVAVDPHAKMGASLETEYQMLASLERRPDILIVYEGNNEFLARYEGSRDVALDEAPLDPILNRMYRLTQRSWLCRMVYETVNKHRLGGPPGLLKRHQVIDPTLCSPSEYDAVLSDFRRRLDALAGYCERIGAIPILVIPAGNESGFEPTRTALPAASKSERAALIKTFQAARALEESDPARSREAYRDLVRQQPTFAEAHFRLARLLEGTSDWDGARRHYGLALDHDGFPVRCASPFKNAYREVAARHGCILIDGSEALRAVTPHGIVDDHAIHDAHHPTLAGQVAIAQAILDALHARKALGWDASVPPDLTPAACAREFNVDAEAWQVVCAKTSTFYRDFSHARYDRTERLEKMRVFADAGRRIAEGIPPETTGVPGIGTGP